MPFTKGHKTNVGRKLSPSAKEKLLVGFRTWKKLNPTPWNKGKKMPDSMREKLRKIVTGNKRRLGKPHTSEWKLNHSGPRHHSWKGGYYNTEEKVIRHSFAYKQFRKAVFERDDYRCFDCGERGGQLNVDHIFPFARFPRLRLDMSNARTLCVKCHRRTPTYGGRTTFARVGL